MTERLGTQRETNPGGLPMLCAEDIDRVTLGRDQEGYREGAVGRVIVMANGRITESGTYEELLARPDGLFTELHRLQGGTENGPDTSPETPEGGTPCEGSAALGKDS
ncbi:hypothetical protein [Streptomyces sp. NPDC047024]|uniref:hypothetical protein n=1 Tax=Streptomyces sp. NPDC047024 TaxID=3155476 RepID=UPI0033F63452